jgi:hypothetical protein
MNDNKFWLILWVTLAVCATVFGCWILEFSNERTEMFINAGYTRECLPGYDWPQWVKKGE